MVLHQLPRPVLVIEAVLSTYHDTGGNPGLRGDFEKGRGWYHGPGVTTFAAAMEFLKRIGEAPGLNFPIPVCEALLSYKTKTTDHRDDAKRIVDKFWKTRSVEPRCGSLGIDGAMDGPALIKLYSAWPGFGKP